MRTCMVYFVGQVRVTDGCIPEMKIPVILAAADEFVLHTGYIHSFYTHMHRMLSLL